MKKGDGEEEMQAVIELGERGAWLVGWLASVCIVFIGIYMVRLGVRVELEKNRKNVGWTREFSVWV